MALGSEVAFTILFMKYSVFPHTVKKGGNIDKVGKMMKGMLQEVCAKSLVVTFKYIHHVCLAAALRCMTCTPT